MRTNGMDRSKRGAKPFTGGMEVKYLNQAVVVGGKRYNTETATLLAGDDYWDGHNWERSGRNSFLFRTPKGAYFVQRRSQWQGESDGATEVLTHDEAMAIYDSMRERRVEFEEAFPGVTVEDA